MTDFEKWNDRYQRKWCTKTQLKRLVALNALTAEEYQTITGEAYAA